MFSWTCLHWCLTWCNEDQATSQDEPDTLEQEVERLPNFLAVIFQILYVKDTVELAMSRCTSSPVHRMTSLFVERNRVFLLHIAR